MDALRSSELRNAGRSPQPVTGYDRHRRLSEEGPPAWGLSLNLRLLLDFHRLRLPGGACLMATPERTISASVLPGSGSRPGSIAQRVSCAPQRPDLYCGAQSLRSPRRCQAPRSAILPISLQPATSFPDPGDSSMGSDEKVASFLLWGA